MIRRGCNLVQSQYWASSRAGLFESIKYYIRDCVCTIPFGKRCYLLGSSKVAIITEPLPHQFKKHPETTAEYMYIHTYMFWREKKEGEMLERQKKDEEI